MALVGVWASEQTGLMIPMIVASGKNGTSWVACCSFMDKCWPFD